MNPRLAGDKIDSFQLVLLFQLLWFRKHSSELQW